MADIGNNNENIEITQIEEIEADEAGEEETNLDDDEDLELDDTQDELPNQSISVPQGLNPDLGEAPEAPSGADVGSMKRVFTRDRKIFLKNALNVSLNKGDGPNSTILFDNLQLTNDQRTGKNNGAKYKGVKILILKDGEYTFSSSVDKKIKNTITEFKATLEKAKAEHAKTAVAETEKQFEDAGVENPSQEDVDFVLSDVEEQLNDRFEELKDEVLEIRRGRLTKAEVDALIGVFSFDRTQKMTPEEQIKFLTEAELPHWREKLKEAKKEDQNSVRTKQITGVVEMMELKADMLRIRNNLKHETLLVKNLIKTEAKIGDISRFRRFSKWTKENLLALSAVAISAAGIITTIVIAGRGAVKAGGRVTKKFARGLAKVTKNVAPVLGAVLNLVGNVLKLAAKALDWVSKNLWSLALLIVFFLVSKINDTQKQSSLRRS